MSKFTPTDYAALAAELRRCAAQTDQAKADWRTLESNLWMQLHEAGAPERLTTARVEQQDDWRHARQHYLDAADAQRAAESAAWRARIELDATLLAARQQPAAPSRDITPEVAALLKALGA